MSTDSELPDCIGDTESAQRSWSSSCTKVHEIDQPKESSKPNDEDIEKQLSSPTPTESSPSKKYSRLKKALIVPILCCAQFFDIFISSAALIALPQIGSEIGFASSSLQWVVTAYTLTFASFQLVGGRLTDIYHAKPVFVGGLFAVGFFSILCGVSVHPIMLIVFRAIQGIGAAFTLPSAVALIVQSFSDPAEQARALAAFAAFGAVGNSTGFVLGGVLTFYIGWKWVFFIVAMLVIPLAILSWIALPGNVQVEHERKRGLDIPGVTALTGGLILFVYSISDANTVGWGKPQILVTLILSGVLVIAFFVIERFVKDPAVPSRIWFNKGAIPLFVYSLSIYWFLTGAELQFVQVFQDLWGWSALDAALHCIPIGVVGGISSHLTGIYGPRIPRRILLPFGQILLIIGAALFATADTPNKYWSHILPGMIVGIWGLAMAYVAANISLMSSAKPGEEGVMGALMNTAFQLGSTIGVAVMTAIALGVNGKQPLDTISQFKGYAMSFWSLVALHGMCAIIVVLWVR